MAIYFAVMLAVNTIAFWMPSLIHGAGIAQDSRIGMLSAVPYLAGCAFMIFIGRSSDRLRERRWHLGIPLLMAAAGLSLAALAPTSAWLVMGGLVIAGMGASAALPMFWQLPPAFLSSATLAAGIALISSFGSIAAFLAPYLIGWMRDTTQSASLACTCWPSSSPSAPAWSCGPRRRGQPTLNRETPTMLDPRLIQEAANRLDAAERSRQQ